MNQTANPAWQGAAQVARARLQTIDQALAKLETLVPDSGVPPPSADNQPGSDDRPDGPNRPKLDTQTITPQAPASVPVSSAQALEAFLETAYQKRYMPKAV